MSMLTMARYQNSQKMFKTFRAFPRVSNIFFEKGGNVIVSTDVIQPKYCYTRA